MSEGRGGGWRLGELSNEEGSCFFWGSGVSPKSCLYGTSWPLHVSLPREPLSWVRGCSWVAGMGVRGGFG